MSYKLKRISLVLVAALALTAFVASAAQAQFTLSPVITLSGTQKAANEFTAGSGFPGIICSTASFHGTSAIGSSDGLAMSPSYGGCKDSFGRTVHISKNTLSYSLTSGATAGETKSSVVISGELVYTVTEGADCTVSIGAQTVSGVSYKNLGTTNGVEITWNIGNMKNNTSGGFFICGVSNGEHTGGTYTGTTVVAATQNGAAIQLSLD
jgi:hypothetical protein